MLARTLVPDRQGSVYVDLVEQQSPGTGEVAVRTACSLISPGTELHYLRLGVDVPLGYCAAGVIERVGQNVTGVSVGDRVVAMGWEYARHSECFTIPYRLVSRLPDEISFGDGVLAALGATAVHATDRARLDGDDEALVVGAGVVGQLVAQVARDRTARVGLVDHNDERIAAAAALRDVLDVQAFRVYDFTRRSTLRRVLFLCFAGSADAVWPRLLDWLRHTTSERPVVVVVGRIEASLSLTVDLGNMDMRVAARCGTGYRDERYVRGLCAVTPPEGEGTVDANLARAVEMIGRGVIRPERMRIADMSLGDARSAYDLLAKRGSVISVRFHYTAPDTAPSET